MRKLIENTKNYKTLAAWLHGGRFPHAILLEGAGGSGRSSFAGEIAQILLCEGEPVPCGQCAHCQKVKKNIHPDFLTFQGEGGSRSFHISVVREIRKEAWVSANEGKAKVFLLKNAEEMSVQAQNALLKLIEEPPTGVYFILTCENRNQMLTTIRSRTACLTMNIPDVDNAIAVLEALAEGRSAETIREAAIMYGGNIGQSLDYLMSDNEKSPFLVTTKLWEDFTKGDYLSATAALSAFERDKEGFRVQLRLLRSIVSAQLRTGERNSPRAPGLLQLSQIIDIIDEVALASESNVNMLLLVSVLPAKIGGVLSGK